MKKFMHKPCRVLVVGTTLDYINWIKTIDPDRALFLTDYKIRGKASEPVPSSEAEVLTDLNNHKDAIQKLFLHLDNYRQRVTGIACFDCESLELAAKIAPVLNLKYPSLEAIRNCRDKYISKEIWQKNGIPCPKISHINSIEEAIRFLKKCEHGIVLKPFYGSGSELVFRCRTEQECQMFFQSIKEGLKEKISNPIFKKSSSQNHLMLAEEFVVGPEYSCDFIVDESAITIVRIAKKIKPSNKPFGTVSGYMIPVTLPLSESMPEFEKLLLKSASVLGINRGICMVDFIISNNVPNFIEMTPRPGGDCLPALLKEAGNLDILGLSLDFAEYKHCTLNGYKDMSMHIGFLIHAHKNGILKGFDTKNITGEKRIKSIQFTRKPGHVITMPPVDYDSWHLGHIIIKPDDYSHPETQSLLIGKRLKVEIE